MEHSYCCKHCGMSFSSGRVLGGHMRRHLVRKSAAAQLSGIAETNSGGCDDPARGYGLRENPKKSWKASHLSRGTAEEGRGPYRCRICGEVFASPKSLSNHMRIHSKIFKLRMSAHHADILADVEPICPSRRKRSLRVFCYSPDHHHHHHHHHLQQPPIPSPVSEADQEDGMELAFGLMLLSRGLRDPVDGDSMLSLSLINQVFRKAKEPDSDHKEDPDEGGKLIELELPVGVADQETKNKNAETPFVLGSCGIEGSVKPGGEISKGLEGGYGSRSKKPKLSGIGNNNSIKIKTHKGKC